MGYDTFMVYVNTSLEIALERNAARDRKVDPKLVKKFWQDVQDNMGGFQRLFKGNFSIVDNSSRDNKHILDAVWKEVMKFSRVKPKNAIAKEWIAKELEKRKS